MNCLDTYALVELSSGNPKFSTLMKEEFVIPDPTMAEFYLVIKKKHNDETANYWHRKLAQFCKPVPRQTLINALLFREENKAEDISVFDAVGYVFARENKHAFVTGDKAFRNKTGVMFIQK
ncbi:TPA: PIN domain-containing protein [Candidatus Woesearchaeota archaeon]|nr:PIN domain-containing protein [Candidatus Woesearchaeota archaeon]